MKRSVLLIFIFQSCFLLAQQNIVGTGGDAVGSGGNASFSLGQLDYIQLSSQDGSAGLGVQQPYEIYVVGVEEQNSAVVSVILFPNPTTDDVKLKISNEEYKSLEYTLYDMSGRVLQQTKISAPVSIVPMADLQSSTYFLAVSEGSAILKTFKIIKNQ